MFLPESRILIVQGAFLLGYTTYADRVSPDQPMHPSTLTLVSLSVKNDDSSLDSVAHRSDWAVIQTELEVHCPHMAYYLEFTLPE